MKSIIKISVFFLMLILALGLSSSGHANIDEVRISNTSANTKATQTIKGLVILIDFADRNAYFTPAEVDSFFNQRGYSKYGDNGSVRDYWYTVSQGRVDVQTIVTPAYYKAPKPFAYYDTDGGSGHTHELLDSALNWLDKRGFDFSQLTVDENKNIKALSFQFVGNSGAKGLWGHSSGHGRTFDGVKTSSYQISELGTTEMRLGGICHEQGHMLFGWPDSYDIDGANGGSSGCGKFDLMAGGNSDKTGAPSQNPMPPNPYFRYLKGWNDMIPINNLAQNTLLKIPANSWNTYVYRNPDKPGEMYIIEARKKPYRNVDMPGEGVLIWHIDSVIPNNANQHRTEQKHYKVSVVQADNAFHLESGANNGDANDYFRGGYTSTVTYNHTKWWNSAFSGLQLRTVSTVADTMTAKFGSINETDVAIKSDVTTGGTVSPFGLRYYTLNANQAFTATAKTGFEVYDCVVDNVSQGPIAKYTFSAIDAPHTISHSFIHKAVPLKDIVNVVNYKYYEGNWSSLPNFSTLTPVKSGTISTVTLSIPGRVSDNFGIVFTGYIKAPADGEYTFYLTSDDGSRFLIDGIEIVANQVQPEKSGKIMLREGYHPFTLEFFEGQVSESLYLRWSSKGMSKRNLTGFVTGTPNYTDVFSPEADSKIKIWLSLSELCMAGVDIEKPIVEIYNVSGILMDKRQLEINAGTAQFSIENLPKGIYFVRLLEGSRVRAVRKVCLMKFL
jgi:M6 family metalloprotease-like protein